MSIKSKEVITAADLNRLKNYIKNIYRYRGLIESILNNDGSEDYETFTGTALTTSTFSVGDLEHFNEIKDLFNSCLIINDIPNLLWTDLSNNANAYINMYEKIFGDGTETELINWVQNIYSKYSDDEDHGCRGACIGICYGSCYKEAKGTGKVNINDASGSPNGNNACDCSGGCQGVCKGCSSCSGCGDWATGDTGVAGACAGCTGQCSGCQGKCSGCAGCTGCNTECAGSCQGGCFRNCYNTCDGACSGACQGCNTQCGAECKDTCKNACHNTCKNGCAKNCTNGCYGSSTGGIYT